MKSKTKAAPFVLSEAGLLVSKLFCHMLIRKFSADRSFFLKTFATL